MGDSIKGDFGRPAPERTGYDKPDIQRPPDSDIPEFDKDVPDEHESTDERRRQERGNRGPDEEPGFGQGV